VRARASKGLGANEELDLSSFKALELGEHKDQILQAACRGAVRKCIGDQCGAMDLYIIASAKTGIPYDLHDIFPGARLSKWQPNEKPLGGLVGKTIDYIREYFATSGIWPKPLPFSQVWKAMGINRQNFNQNIRKHPDFCDALAKINVGEFSRNGSRRLTHFQRDCC
jgi:hypothetical protein